MFSVTNLDYLRIVVKYFLGTRHTHSLTHIDVHRHVKIHMQINT